MYQRETDNNHILGVMLESNLYAGNQSIPNNLDDLQYGISVTDECMDWDTTETIIRAAFSNNSLPFINRLILILV